MFKNNISKTMNYSGLLSLIDSDSNEVIKNLISLITRYGHTSGYDTLYGCYLGLKSLKSDN